MVVASYKLATSPLPNTNKLEALLGKEGFGVEKAKIDQMLQFQKSFRGQIWLDWNKFLKYR